MSVLELDQPLVEPPQPVGDESSWRARDRAAGAGLDVPRPLRAFEPVSDAATRLAVGERLRWDGSAEALAVTLTISGPGGRQRLRGVARVMLDADRTGAMVIADPLVLLTVDAPAGGSVRWSLVGGGPSVTARADALRFLRALRLGGELTFELGHDRPLPAVVTGSGSGWTLDDEREWRLFEDLATLEEWTGTDLPMPETLDGSEVGRIAQAAAWIRSGRVITELSGPLRFHLPEPPSVDVVHELRVHQRFGVEVMGTDLSLGEGVARIPVERFVVTSTASEGGVWVEAESRRSRITFVLRPPPSRRLPAYRRQASPGSAPDGHKGPAYRLPVSARASRSMTDLLDRVAARAGSEPSAAIVDGIRDDRA